MDNDIKIYGNVKRVLHVTGGMNRGGAEAMIMNIYRGMNKDKLQFDFLAFSDKECDFDREIIQLGGKIINVKYLSLLKPWIFVREIKRVIKSNGPYEAVHAHTLFNIGWICLAARLSGVKLRVAHAHSTKDTLHDSVFRKIYQFLMRILIKYNASAYVACGKEAGEFLFGEKFNSKGTILPNAVDLNSFQNNNYFEIINDLRKDLKIDDNEKIIIGQVGNLKEVKNHRFSLLIALELKKMNTEFQLIFVGDGDLRVELEEQMELYGLKDNVTFLGSRNDVNCILGLFDVLIMPSLYEGLPLSLIEAQAAGVKCIVSSAITKEVDLGLDLVSFIDLKDGSMYWAQRVASINKNDKRINNEIIKKAFQESGYDVENNIKAIYSLYKLNLNE